MKIYNTMTRGKEDFKPVKDGAVSMYVCGPTVYNYIHLGNARPCVVFDTVRRFFEALGYDVLYATNFTDVDDKIIAKANDEGVDTSVITGRYIAEALVDTDGLNCLRASLYPRVTEEMPDIIEFVKKLCGLGYAYETDGTVYFDTAVKDGYGKLSQKKIEDLESGARVETDTKKKNVSDFVLWKPAKPGEPFWDSPWGRGRPGWHIECSSMIKKYAGETLDIHAGGEDLIFPHHENEIAQSEAANGAPLSNIWMHNGMVNADGEKMSKSDGNFFLVREAAKRFGYDVIRFYILTVHYRNPINFSADNIEAAHNGLLRIRNCSDALKDIAGEGELDEGGKEVLLKAEAFKERFFASMSDDFNTANAIADIFELVKFINVRIAEGVPPALARELHELLLYLCGILGVRLDSGGAKDDESLEIDALVKSREEARTAKDWALADKIRNDLALMGIEIKDTPEGAKWRRKGTVN